MGETTVLRAGDPRVAELIGTGWRMTARSWAAQLDADRADRAALRRFVERVAPIVVGELGDADLPAVLALDAATVTDYPGSVATQHEALTESSAALSSTRRAFGAWSPSGDLVGTTYLDVDGDTVETAFTVIARDHRGRGIGTAVKAASVLALLDEDVVRFRTGGSADNPAIIAAGAAVGYLRDEEWVTLESVAR
ncbi:MULTISPECIES: acetyltransferase [Curtobacterium]|uniref:acetyltransferase n=1 Tax=Curtobacterium flaccumfaciens TaxID=2035 RepID=UPI003EE6EF8B